MISTVSLYLRLYSVIQFRFEMILYFVYIGTLSNDSNRTRDGAMGLWTIDTYTYNTYIGIHEPWRLRTRDNWISTDTNFVDGRSIRTGPRPPYVFVFAIIHQPHLLRSTLMSNSCSVMD